MCGGFSYNHKDPALGEVKVKKVFFPIPFAQVPYIYNGQIAMAQWGKRKGEDSGLDVPQTGWARIESLVEHKWDKYNPSRVRIPALSFMEKDNNRESHWFDMEEGAFLLGVKIDKPEKSFVYVVTKPAEAWFAQVHDRQPMTVSL